MSEAPRGWLGRLKAGRARASGKLGDGISGIFTKRRLDEAALEELEELLISADLGVATAAKLTAELARERFNKDVSPEEVRRASHDGMSLMGLPSRTEMSARYGERTGLDVSMIGWYEAFAQWKTAVVVQQLHHRWKVGNSTDPRMETVAEKLPLLIVNADRRLQSIGV